MAPRSLPDREYLRDRFTYNPETGILTRKHLPREYFTTQRGWSVYQAKFAGHPCDSQSVRGYLVMNLEYVALKVHRVIWKLQTGEEPPSIDHKNGILDDNRWTNLRAATLTQNRANSKANRRSDGIPMAKGVVRTGNRWKSQIWADGKSCYLGCFPSEALAADAYDKAAKRLHGEFARPRE